MLRGQGLPPEIPIGRKEAQAHRDDMLFEFEGADSPKVAEFLHRNSDVGAVLDVNPRAHERLEYVDDGDQGGVGRCRHRAAIDEITRRLSRRHQDGHRLKRNCGEQRDREQEMSEEQDFPERVFSYYAEYYVHGVSPLLVALADDARLVNNYPTP